METRGTLFWQFYCFNYLDLTNYHKLSKSMVHLRIMANKYMNRNDLMKMRGVNARFNIACMHIMNLQLWIGLKLTIDDCQPIF